MVAWICRRTGVPAWSVKVVISRVSSKVAFTTKPSHVAYVGIWRVSWTVSRVGGAADDAAGTATAAAVARAGTRSELSRMTVS